MKKTLTALMLVFALCTASASPAFAAEIQTQSSDTTSSAIGITPFWLVTTSVTNNFNITGKTAAIRVSVRCDSYITSIGVKAEVQKKSGTSWTTMKTYSDTYYTFYGTTSESYALSSGEWRLKTTVKPYKNGVLQETITLYTYDDC